MNEIQINKPKISSPLSEETKNIIKDRVIKYIKEIIQDYNNSVLYDLLDDTYISEGDSNYDIVSSFIIEQMIANNYELYHNGEEILLTNSNSNLVTKEDIENYLEENTRLKKYLEKISWKYYFDEINIDDLYSKCIKYVRNQIEDWGEGEFDKDEFESMVDKALDNQDTLYPDNIFNYNPEFQDYLQTKFLKADKLSEIKINKPGQFIKLNLPKDLDREIDPESSFDDIILELIALNPQIPEDVFTAYDTSGLGDDIIDDLDENVSLQEFLQAYFYWLCRNLFHYYNGYGGQQDMGQVMANIDVFKNNALNGKWKIISGLTDFKNDKPYDEDLNETQLLREYPESTVSKILTKWEIDPNPQSSDSKIKAARALITRFEQIKNNIPQKLNILVIPDEVKRKDPRNIELYSLEDMIKLIKSYPENPDKVKKDAIENFATKYSIDKATAQSYVARFMTKKDNLKYAIENGTEDGNFTKEEVLELIPKRLLQNNLYLDPRNWQWQPFEQALDSLFPSQKQVTGEEGDNEATTDADKIYDKDGIEIYQGDDVHKCISYNPVDTQTKRKKYGWCVTQIGNTNYDYYRFAESSPTFYFVFDRSKESTPEHSPFKDQWHAFVIQVNANGESYVITSADNRGDTKAKSWETIPEIVPADTWAKIKNLKQYFKPIALSAVERGRKFVSGKNLSLDEFKELNQDEKILYVQGKASKNTLSNDILSILPQYKISLEGRSTTLANVAIDSGQTFPYSILKDNEALAKRYAVFRFRHTNYGSTPIPLPYIKYLNEPGQKKYYEEFGKGGSEESFLTFELIEKYFGKEVTKQYVNSQLKHLGFLPPEAINYIDNPKLKTLFKAVSKLYEPWKYGKYTNISDEELADAKSQPPQDVTPIPIDVKQWAKLTSEERKILIELTEKYNKNPDYLELMYASPFIIKDKGQTLVLLPEPGSEGTYDKWILINDQDKVIKRNISGDSTLDGDPIASGYTNGATDDLKRVYDISDLEIEESDSKSLDEIQIKKPGFKTWDFTKSIPNLNPDDIKIGDRIIWPSPNSNRDTQEYTIKAKSYNNQEVYLKTEEGRTFIRWDLMVKNEMNKIRSLNEIKVNKPGDFSNPITLKILLDKIPNEKYFPELEDFEGEERYEDSEMVDVLYDPIFDDYLKGKPGIKGEDFGEFQDIERGEYNSDETGEIGPLERLLIDKIKDIVKDYRNQQEELGEIQIKKPLPSIKLNFPNIATVNLDNWKELNKVIETIAKLNPKIPEDTFYAGSVVDDISDYKNGPTVPFKNFLKSYFYWLARNLFYDFNYDEENEQGHEETLEQHNEQKRFAEVASNGTWLLIPNISDFRNPISEINDGNDLWELMKPEFELDIKELLDEIQINKPNTLKSLVTSYAKYLESISRAEMFDESGNYNSTLKNYHNKLKYYTENGTKEEQITANFILGLI
jgi:hypothetical protein